MTIAHGPLLWSDEFAGPGIDRTKWRYEPSASMQPPINDEQQRYLAESNHTARLADGHLVLTARRDPFGGIVSARLSTFELFSFTYGVVEARMRVPYVRGFWPAFWMLGANVRDVGWPACGEVDIMEVFGHRRGRHACSTVHNMQHSWGTRDPLDGGCVPLEAPTPGWHVWRMVWTASRIAFYLDEADDPYWSYERPADAGDDAFPYTRPQYFIVNLAVGGNGPSEPIDDGALDGPGTSLAVDYVRVYALPKEAVDESVAINMATGSAPFTTQAVGSAVWAVAPAAAAAGRFVDAGLGAGGTDSAVAQPAAAFSSAWIMLLLVSLVLLVPLALRGWRRKVADRMPAGLVERLLDTPIGPNGECQLAPLDPRAV